MDDKELIRLWEIYDEKGYPSDRDEIIRELINRSLEKSGAKE